MTTGPEQWAAMRGQGHYSQTGDDLCGPECRYKGLYESGQQSLVEMARNHAGVLEEHQDLRAAIVSMMKRLFGGEVQEVERKGGVRLADVDDGALMMYLEGFVADYISRGRTNRAGLETLRAVLNQQGYELPDGHDLTAWAGALVQQKKGNGSGFPATAELASQSLDDIDVALKAMLEAEGLTTQVEGGAGAVSAPDSSSTAVRVDDTATQTDAFLAASDTSADERTSKDKISGKEGTDTHLGEGEASDSEVLDFGEIDVVAGLDDDLASLEFEEVLDDLDDNLPQIKGISEGVEIDVDEELADLDIPGMEDAVEWIDTPADAVVDGTASRQSGATGEKDGEDEEGAGDTGDAEGTEGADAALEEVEPIKQELRSEGVELESRSVKVDGGTTPEDTLSADTQKSEMTDLQEFVVSSETDLTTDEDSGRPADNVEPKIMTDDPALELADIFGVAPTVPQATAESDVAAQVGVDTEVEDAGEVDGNDDLSALFGSEPVPASEEKRKVVNERLETHRGDDSTHAAHTVDMNWPGGEPLSKDIPFVTPDGMDPAGLEDLAAMFEMAPGAGASPHAESVRTATDNEDNNGDPTDEAGTASGSSKSLDGAPTRKVKPTYVTPGELGATRMKPDLMVAAQHSARSGKPSSKKEKSQKAKKRVRAQRPEKIQFDVPALAESGVGEGGELTDQLVDALTSAVEVPRPVFVSTLGETVESAELAEAWETRMRTVNSPPVRFLSPRRHHKAKGSLAIPYEYRKRASLDFQRSWWGEMLEMHRGIALYELGILLETIGDDVVGHVVAEDVVQLRVNLVHGLTGIIVVCGDTLEPAGATREAIAEAVESLQRERLATLLVLPIRRSRVDAVTELLRDEGRTREWDPPMPVAVTSSPDYAKDRGASAKVALGNV